MTQAETSLARAPLHRKMTNNAQKKKIIECQKLIEAHDYEPARKILKKILKQYKPGRPAEIQEVQALIFYADIQRLTGFYADAYKNYCVVLGQKPDLEPRLLDSIFHCLVNPIEFEVNEVLCHHLRLYLASENTDNAQIENLIATTIKRIFHTDDPDYPLELDFISSHPLLLEALPLLVLPDASIELFLIGLRSHLLTTLLTNGLIPELVSIVIAMSARGHRTEFVSTVPEIERPLVEGLHRALSDYLSAPQGLELVVHLMLALSMYQSITEFPQQPALRGLSSEPWPPALTKLQEIFHAAETESALKPQIKVMGGITDLVSRKVRQQYEGNPYPQWNSLQVVSEKRHMLSAFNHMENIEQREKFNHELQVLVAGCGTGRHPVYLSNTVDNIKITALDLSLASLAYGQRMADKFGCENIDFIQGDLLRVDQLQQQFDVIESVGVLHHMKDPAQGLAALIDILAPAGILNLGLYSELARVEIKRIIDTKIPTGTESSKQNIQQIRDEILVSSTSPESKLILSYRDFFSLSECRDLLFHEQEHRFTIPQIEKLLADHGLRFAGFRGLSNRAYAAYTHQFPDDIPRLNLANWHQFELLNHTLFSGMYQFYCQKM